MVTFFALDWIAGALFVPYLLWRDHRGRAQRQRLDAQPERGGTADGLAEKAGEHAAGVILTAVEDGEYPNGFRFLERSRNTR